MVRTNQGGSVLGFIAIGVVLAGLLVGGVFFVRQQTAKQPQPAPENPTSQPTQPEPAQTTPSADDKKTETPPAEESAATPPVSTDKSVTELPKTGSTETLSAMLALGLLSTVIVSYARSRRLRLSF